MIIMEVIGSLAVIAVGAVFMFFGALGSDKRAWFGGMAAIVGGVALIVWTIVSFSMPPA